MQDSNSVSTPKQNQIGESTAGGTLFQSYTDWQAPGSSISLMICTRLDLFFAVFCLSQYLEILQKRYEGA